MVSAISIKVDLYMVITENVTSFPCRKKKSHELLKVILKIFLPVCTINQNYACPTLLFSEILIPYRLLLLVIIP